ncbi:hypothetical protein LTS18_013180, partial [Coniosporium uncinatum]
MRVWRRRAKGGMLRPSALLDAQVHALADFCALQALADQAADGYATHIDHTH